MSDPEPDAKRRRLESVIPKIIKRAVERGVERAQDAPDNVKSFLHDLKVPKEVAQYLLSQIDETKNGLFRVVASEMRDFLEETNFSGELQKILTTVQFEVNTTIRFTPNENKNAEGAEGVEGDGAAPGLGKPEVKTQVYVRREERDRRKIERARAREAAREKKARERAAPASRDSVIPPPPRVPTPAPPRSDEDRNDP